MLQSAAVQQLVAAMHAPLHSFLPAEARFTSQPFDGLPSQSAKPAAQVPVHALVVAAREAASGFHALSLDLPTDPDQPSTEIVPTEGGDPFAALDDAAWLGEALGELTERERLVLRLRFVDVLTQSDIAERIGVSQMQVSRILRSTLTRLRSRLQLSLEDAA